MIKFLNVKIQQIAVHKVGNKALEDGISYSDNLIKLEDENLVKLFLKYFLSSFSGNEMFNLQHDIDIEMNEMFSLAKSIFTNSENLLENSKKITQHLYNCSLHPKIKNGELYVVYFTDIILNEESTNAVGIFKSETKDNYLKINLKDKKMSIDYDEGTNTNKLDKGCLIFNVNQEQGYKVCIIDNLNKANEAVYWKDNFLNITPIKNEYHQTNQFLRITKNFVTKHLSEEFEVSKADKIDLLNRSVEYFKTNDIFDKKEFGKRVFENSDLIDSFQKFNNNYSDENEIISEESFTISPVAVKKQARIFKSVLKLDKNFHIYIHGSKELIEQGVDENGKKFYKIYYDNEF